MKKEIIFVTVLILLITTSCATIVSGTKQNVKFSSNPSSATVFIDEVEMGKTPFEIRLSRTNEHSVMIKLDGYQTYETKLTKSFNAWYLGNIVFGGIIGLVVDASTGAIYNLTPSEINAEMNNGTTFNKSNGNIYFAISLNSDPNWEKIGQLEKSND